MKICIIRICGCLLIGAVALFRSASAQAAAGDLDTSFGGTGIVTTAIGSSDDLAQSVTMQTNGKIVAAGYSFNGGNHDFALVRYNSDGSLDTTFNGTGKLTTDFGSRDDRGYGVAMQGDGKIVVAGSSYNLGSTVFALARYNADGSLDISFNGTGKVTTNIGSITDEAYCVAVEGDGKILVAGRSQTSGYDNFALVRYNSDGSMDRSFNGTGIVTTDVAGGYSESYSVTLQGDGKILAAGRSRSIYGADSFALARYNTNGTLDTSFNGTGTVTTNFNAYDSDGGARSVAVQSDEKIVVAGTSGSYPNERAHLSRTRRILGLSSHH